MVVKTHQVPLLARKTKKRMVGENGVEHVRPAFWTNLVSETWNNVSQFASLYNDGITDDWMMKKVDVQLPRYNRRL